MTERLKANKTPQWLGNAKAAQTFTYTPDAGCSLAVLGITPSAYGQVSHALTSKEPITGEQYVRIASIGTCCNRFQPRQKIRTRCSDSYGTVDIELRL